MAKIVVILLSVFVANLCAAKECTILLHGLLRSSSSMLAMENALSAADFTVVNIDYPSRSAAVAELAEAALARGIDECKARKAYPTNIVTHSLGGILVRYYFSHHSAEAIHRVLMLGPPNKGSQVVDNLKNVPGYELINGPAGMQLGTDSAGIPQQLGAVNFELGVIAGTKTFNPILSLYLPNPDDGKVSLENTKVSGMCAFLALPVTHTFMMKNKSVIAETISFLKTGRFSDAQAEYYCATSARG